jgi:hypothetical protein
MGSIALSYAAYGVFPEKGLKPPEVNSLKNNEIELVNFESRLWKTACQYISRFFFTFFGPA